MFALPMVLISMLLFIAILFKKKIKLLAEKSFFKEFQGKDYYVFAFILLFSAVYLYLTKNSLTLWGISVLKVPITHSYFLIRHSFFLAPLLYVSFACAIGYCRSKKSMATALLVLMLLNGISLNTYYHETTKTQWKEAVAFIQEHSAENPLILLDRGGGSNAFLLNYYSDATLQIINLTKIEGRNTLIKTNPEKLFKTLEKESTFWLVFSGNSHTKEYYKNLLDQRYTLVASQEFYQVKTYKYNNSKKDNLK